MKAIKAVITTLDNLPILKEQVAILRDDLLISEIIVVNNGSKDGTREWLVGQDGLTVVNRDNRGAGPGRNSGLDVAGEFDFVLMLDGGIRPLRGGTKRMLEYLERHSEVDVVAPDWHDLETDSKKAWRRWPHEIRDENTYRNRCISLTHYCLARARAFDGFRFSEEGPFGESGWGADDDEMMHRWDDAGIVVHSVQGIKAYRRASGSFRRLYEETGIWPNQYGSVYEKRLVWLQQEQPHHGKGMQWGEPWLTVVVKVGDVEGTAKLIKHAHDRLRERKFGKPWDYVPNPYGIVAWCPDPDHPFLDWAEPRRLRQHHGDTIIVDGEIVRRKPENEETWTGDFRVWIDKDWRKAIRPRAYYYGLVWDLGSLEQLLNKYNAAYPPQPENIPPSGGDEL